MQGVVFQDELSGLKSKFVQGLSVRDGAPTDEVKGGKVCSALCSRNGGWVRRPSLSLWNRCTPEGKFHLADITNLISNRSKRSKWRYSAS